MIDLLIIIIIIWVISIGILSFFTFIGEIIQDIRDNAAMRRGGYKRIYKEPYWKKK